MELELSLPVASEFNIHRNHIQETCSFNTTKRILLTMEKHFLIKTFYTTLQNFK